MGSDVEFLQLIPDDKTGNFETIYNFLEDNWKIAKWVALGAVILEVSVIYDPFRLLSRGRKNISYSFF